LKSINNIQDEIIEEFSMLEGELDMCVEYLIELGKKLEPLNEQHHVDDNIVKGCQSKVWLVANQEEGLVTYHADSNTMITKGLVSMLIRVLSGQTADDILNADLYFINRIGMNRFIGTQRSNGLAAMIKQMKLYALAFMAKEQKKESS
jgi:cysteine desulfuration protein SufE